MFLAYLALTVAFTTQMTQAAEPPERPLVGAIRWDAWTEWEKYQDFLQDPQWSYRLPFFAKTNEAGRIIIRSDSQEIMDQEIEYASKAGIDYWAWVWYDPTGSTGLDYHMNDALDLYMSSTKQDKINHCLIGTEYWLTQRWDEAIWYILEHFTRPNYQRVAGNRPLYYWFDAQNVPAHFGGMEKAQAALKQLRDASIAAGLGNPYLVGLTFWPDKCEEAVRQTGFDATGAYCSAGDVKNTERPYSLLRSQNQWYWSEWLKRDLPMIPPINSGWDTRPRASTLQNPEGDWYTQATPQEIAENLKDAMDFVRKHPKNCPADSVLIYAWNEFDEGGWLCPTLEAGTARLDAIQKMLENYESPAAE